MLNKITRVFLTAIVIGGIAATVAYRDVFNAASLEVWVKNSEATGVLPEINILAT